MSPTERKSPKKGKGNLEKGHTHLGGTLTDCHTGSLESRNLGWRTTLTTANDGTSVTHTSTGRCSSSSDETHDRFVLHIVFFQVGSRLFLVGTTDFTNQNDALVLGSEYRAVVWTSGAGTLCRIIVQKPFQAVDKVGAREGVTTHTNAESLTETDRSRLRYSLVGQGTGTRHDTWCVSAFV